MVSIRAQLAVLVSLLALVPVAVFLANGRAGPLVALAGLNVLIIGASLYYMFGPHEGGEPGGGHAT